MTKGLLKEHAVFAFLSSKCDLKREATYDIVYKLDFIVDRFREIDKLTHIGVQITTNVNDIHKQSEFVAERRKKTLVDRSLYVEIDPEADIDTYASELIYSALVSFAFEKKMKEKDIYAVRINKDVSFEFYDIEQYVNDKKKEIEKLQSQKTEDSTKNNGNHNILHSGRISKYFPERGYGFIVAKNTVGERDSWYFHISDVQDDALMDKLMNWGNGNTVYVEFYDAGYTRKDVLAKTAEQVRLKGK